MKTKLTNAKRPMRNNYFGIILRNFPKMTSVRPMSRILLWNNSSEFSKNDKCASNGAFFHNSWKNDEELFQCIGRRIFKTKHKLRTSRLFEVWTYSKNLFTITNSVHIFIENNQCGAQQD
jgi:hypothetical protein